MLGRALDAGVPASWVTADEAYGQDHKFRTWCERRRIGYVVAVPRSQTIPAGAGQLGPTTPTAARTRAGLETPQLRRRGQRAPAVRLGRGLGVDR